MAAEAPEAKPFLLNLRSQVLQLQHQLRLETSTKLRLLKTVAVLRKSLKIKDGLVCQFLLDEGVKDADVRSEYQKRYQAMLLQCKKQTQQFARYQQLLNEQSRRLEKDQERSFSLDHKPPFNSKSPSEEVPAQGRNPSEHYISPDDGLPDKQLSIFDRSSLDQTQTNVQRHNSLYYLEHQNSQLMGFYNNWQAPSPYKGNPGQFDRSGLGLNQTNTMLGGNTVLNITNLTRNTHFQRLQNENDQSYQRRYQDPPSHSRII